MKDVIYDVEEVPKAGMLVGLSFQHLFAMFGATGSCSYFSWN